MEKHFGQVEYVADPEALEYWQSKNISDEDFKFLSAEKQKLEEENKIRHTKIINDEA